MYLMLTTQHQLLKGWTYVNIINHDDLIFFPPFLRPVYSCGDLGVGEG